MRTNKPQLMHLAVVCLSIVAAAALATGCERRPTDPAAPSAPPTPAPTTISPTAPPTSGTTSSTTTDSATMSASAASR